MTMYNIITMNLLNVTVFGKTDDNVTNTEIMEIPSISL